MPRKINIKIELTENYRTIASQELEASVEMFDAATTAAALVKGVGMVLAEADALSLRESIARATADKAAPEIPDFDEVMSTDLEAELADTPAVPA